ncbi:MAG: type II toxin-antitoxin system VapC family toxin [bacterium]|nr:type II toxin-antitoxin system VapC family toxin [bacterium]
MSDNACVVDASAVLALLHAEPGDKHVRQVLLQGGVFMSTVNYAEIVGKFMETSVSPMAFHEWFTQLGIRLVALDEETAFMAGELKPKTKALGLSLGDRVCLALSKKLNLPALTADVIWQQLAPEYAITLIRHTSL